MKRLFIRSSAALCLLLIVALAACTGGQSGSSSKPPAIAGSSPTPAVSQSSDVVRISSSIVQIPRNGSADAVLTLSISPGFHINANPATFSYLIPTKIEQARDPIGPITMGKPAYPPAITKKFAFSEHPLAVYEGNVSIKLPLRVGSKASEDQQPVFIKVQVQACDNEQCYPPAIVNATLTVEVK
jgi:thiol:disulfide interchange protein DsbD